MSARCYTVATLAAEWQCSEGMVRKAIADKRLSCFRLGTLIRIPVEEVRRFECQNTPSNDSEAVSPSSTGTRPEQDTGSDFDPPIVLGLKRKLGAGGMPGATVHHGPWGE